MGTNTDKNTEKIYKYRNKFRHKTSSYEQMSLSGPARYAAGQRGLIVKLLLSLAAASRSAQAQSLVAAQIASRCTGMMQN